MTASPCKLRILRFTVQESSTLLDPGLIPCGWTSDFRKVAELSS
jgi:hypothetical protein